MTLIHPFFYSCGILFGNKKRIFCPLKPLEQLKLLEPLKQLKPLKQPKSPNLLAKPSPRFPGRTIQGQQQTIKYIRSMHLGESAPPESTAQLE
jgi:hypothetical protein